MIKQKITLQSFISRYHCYVVFFTYKMTDLRLIAAVKMYYFFLCLEINTYYQNKSFYLKREIRNLLTGSGFIEPLQYKVYTDIQRFNGTGNAPSQT